MTKETKPDPREEIPHREMQIQWHEDMLVQLKNGEKPNLHNWEHRIKEPGLKTLDLDLYPNMWHSMGCRYDWNKDFEYRRKTRTVKYWHCVARAIIDEDEGPCNVVLWSTTSMDDMEREINIMKRTDSAATFTTIIETTAELAD